MKKLTLGGLLALAALSGCVVVVDDHRHRPPPSRTYTTTVTYRASWVDCRYVIWREYYGCDDYDIYYCDSLYGYDDDDLLVCLWISRYRRVPIREVVFRYDACGRDLWAVSMHFGLTGHEFYVAGVPEGYAPPPYGNAYGYHWKKQRGFRLTNEEVRALVHLKIGVEYYGYKPHDYFKEHERAHKEGKPHAFREVVVRDYQKAGAGGKNVHQVNVEKKERPWEAKSREEWDKKREEVHSKGKARESSQSAPRHPEAEKARKQFEEAEKARKDEAARRAKEEADRKAREEADRKAREDAARKAKDEADRRKAADDAARRKAEDDARRRAADDAARKKAEDDARRRQEEQKRAEENRKSQENKGGGDSKKGNEGGGGDSKKGGSDKKKKDN